jgi:hypothetical protein
MADVGDACHRRGEIGSAFYHRARFRDGSGHLGLQKIIRSLAPATMPSSLSMTLGPIPHQIPLLILAETGLVGASGILLLLVFVFRAIPFDKRRFFLAATPLMIIAMLDHYLWSYWSGQVLASFCIIWYVLRDQGVDKVLKS